MSAEEETEEAQTQREGEGEEEEEQEVRQQFRGRGGRAWPGVHRGAASEVKGHMPGSPRPTLPLVISAHSRPTWK